MSHKNCQNRLKRLQINKNFIYKLIYVNSLIEQDIKNLQFIYKIKKKIDMIIILSFLKLIKNYIRSFSLNKRFDIFHFFKKILKALIQNFN